MSRKVTSNTELAQSVHPLPKELIQVMSFAKNIRQSRASARANRAMERAINTAASPAMRDELIIAAQRAGLR